MGVVGTAKEMRDSPTGSFELSKHSLTRKFMVQTDSKLDGPLHVTAVSAGIPALYSTYSFGTEFHLFARLIHISAERLEPNSFHWVVTCEYSTPEPRSLKEGGKLDNAGEQANPLLFIPEVSMRTENYQQAVFGVFDKVTNALKPCMASNDEIYTPPPMKDLVRIHLTITRNEDLTSSVMPVALAFTNTCNADSWWGCGPGFWRCMGVTAERQNKQMSDGTQFYYLKVKYDFALKSDGWDTKLLDNGSYYYDSMLMPRKKLKFLSADLHPLDHGPLDGAGGKLAAGATPFFNTFRFYPRVSFAALGLPQSFPATG